MADEKDGTVPETIDLMKALTEDLKARAAKEAEEIANTPSATSDSSGSSTSTESPSTTSSGQSGGNGKATDVEAVKKTGRCSGCDLVVDASLCVLTRENGRGILRHKVKRRGPSGMDTQLCGPVLTVFVYHVFFQFSYQNGAGGFRSLTIQRGAPLDHEVYLEPLAEYISSTMGAKAVDADGRPILGVEAFPTVEVLSWTFVRAS